MQGADVDLLASQVLRAALALDATVENGRPPDAERHVLIAKLGNIEKAYARQSSAHTYNEEDDRYSGALFTMLRAIELAIAKALDQDPPMDVALAKAIARSRTKPAP